MAKNINEESFDEASKLKLKIFGESFEEWLPVFIHSRYTTEVYIYDFFAGSGYDKDGHLGSPLILLDKAKGDDRKYCNNARKEISFFFNEGLTRKSKELTRNVDAFIEKCKLDNNCSNCIYEYSILNNNFKDLFDNISIKTIFENKNFAKFVLLDQYGFSQIDEQVFKNLIAYPKTDFIFFISSSFIRRFKEHPNTKKYIDTTRINFESIKPNEIHRSIANYFRDLIPKEKEYYLHHFSIKKGENGGNYYGLIFGSNHTLGMEKFLKVCWRHDRYSGEANYNIDNNYEEDTLFADLGENVKKDTVAKEIENLIISGEISDNKSGLKYALKRGCEPKLFVDVMQKLLDENTIDISGKFNRQSTNIHNVKEIYIIKRIDNGE